MVRFPDQRFDVWVDVTVVVPADFSLTIRDTSGDIIARDVGELVVVEDTTGTVSEQ